MASAEQNDQVHEFHFIWVLAQVYLLSFLFFFFNINGNILFTLFYILDKKLWYISTVEYCSATHTHTQRNLTTHNNMDEPRGDYVK